MLRYVILYNDDLDVGRLHQTCVEERIGLARIRVLNQSICYITLRQTLRYVIAQKAYAMRVSK
jgi:hypothetical protein